jgi:hypothetical protein
MVPINKKVKVRLPPFLRFRARRRAEGYELQLREVVKKVNDQIHYRPIYPCWKACILIGQEADWLQSHEKSYVSQRNRTSDVQSIASHFTDSTCSVHAKNWWQKWYTTWLTDRVQICILSHTSTVSSFRFNRCEFHRHCEWAVWCSGNALDSYSADNRFESRPGHMLSWLRFFVVVLSPSRQIAE